MCSLSPYVRGSTFYVCCSVGVFVNFYFWISNACLSTTKFRETGNLYTQARTYRTPIQFHVTNMLINRIRLVFSVFTSTPLFFKCQSIFPILLGMWSKTKRWVFNNGMSFYFHTKYKYGYQFLYLISTKYRWTFEVKWCTHEYHLLLISTITTKVPKITTAPDANGGVVNPR